MRYLEHWIQGRCGRIRSTSGEDLAGMTDHPYEEAIHLSILGVCPLRLVSNGGDQ